MENYDFRVEDPAPIGPPGTPKINKTGQKKYPLHFYYYLLYLSISEFVDNMMSKGFFSFKI
jgi:hypothetical protein